MNTEIWRKNILEFLKHFSKSYTLFLDHWRLKDELIHSKLHKLLHTNVVVPVIIWRKSHIKFWIYCFSFSLHRIFFHKWRYKKLKPNFRQKFKKSISKYFFFFRLSKVTLFFNQQIGTFSVLLFVRFWYKSKACVCVY